MGVQYGVDLWDVSALQSDLVDRFMPTVQSGVWCALVDTAFDHGGRPLQWAGLRIALYSDGPLAGLNAVSPLMLPLDVVNEDNLSKQLSRLLRHCQGKPMLSFVLASASPEALHAAWQGVLQVRTDDDQPFVLRLADSRVSQALAKSLREKSWAQITEALDSWLVINRNGQLQALPVPEKMTQSVEEGHRNLKLNPSELEQLMILGQPDALINALQEHFSDLLESTRGASLHQRMQKVCDLASQHKIEGFPDLMALAVADLATDGQLIDDERLPAWLGQKKWDSGHLENALSEFIETAAL